MRNSTLFIVLVFALASCSGSEQQNQDMASEQLDTFSVEDTLPGLLHTVSTNLQDTSVEYYEEEYGAEEEEELNYIVLIEEGYDYDALLKTATKASRLLNYKFDTMNRYYNAEKKKIVLSEDDEDEAWAGEYIFRRFGDSTVSIEMRSAYIDPALQEDETLRNEFYKDSTKMFVFGDMYANREEAMRVLDVVQQKFKKASVISSNIYMGCMH